MLTWLKGLFAGKDIQRDSHQASSPDARLVESRQQLSSRLQADQISVEEDQHQVISLRIKVPSKLSAEPRTVLPPSDGSTDSGRRKRNKRTIAARRTTSLSEFHFATKTRLQKLGSVGIHTVGELIDADFQPHFTAGHIPAAAEGWLKQFRSIVRLYLKVRSLRPIDATILHSVHRRSAKRLASENPVRLFRDVQRFLLSTKGEKMLGANRPPSQEMVERWLGPKV